MQNTQLPDVTGVDVRFTIIADKLTAAGYASHQVGKW